MAQNLPIGIPLVIPDETLMYRSFFGAMKRFVQGKWTLILYIYISNPTGLVTSHGNAPCEPIRILCLSGAGGFVAAIRWWNHIKIHPQHHALRYLDHDDVSWQRKTCWVLASGKLSISVLWTIVRERALSAWELQQNAFPLEFLIVVNDRNTRLQLVCRALKAVALQFGLHVDSWCCQWRYKNPIPRILWAYLLLGYHGKYSLH